MDNIYRTIVTRRFASLLLLGLLLLGCEAEQPEPAQDFSLPSASGESYRLTAREAPVLIINIWASWCRPCKQELPELEALYQRYQGQGLDIWAINVDADPADADAFADALQLSMPVLVDPEMRVATAFDIRAMPTTLLIDRENRIRFRQLGYDPELIGKLETHIDALLSEVRQSSKP